MPFRKAVRASGPREIAARQENGLGLGKRIAGWLDAVVFAGLLGLIVLAVIPYGIVDAWWEAVFECAVFALTAIWILEAVLQEDWQARRFLLLLPLILITLYSLAQTVVWPTWLPIVSGKLTSQRTLTIDRYQTYLTARKTLSLSLFLGLLLLHSSTPGRFRWLVRVVIGVGFVSALFGLLRQSLQAPDSTTGFVLPFLFYGNGYGQFISQNLFAYLMEMAFGLLLGLVLGGGVGRDRIVIYFTLIIPVWAALVLSNSRGGIVSLTIQVIFVAFVSLNWRSARRRSREDGDRTTGLNWFGATPLFHLLFVVVLTGTITAGVFWMGGEQLGVKLATQETASTAESINGTTRRQIWGSSWQLIKQNPWTGVGFGAYFLAIPQYQVASGLLKLEAAHNDYLDLLCNGGVVGLGLAGWFVALLIRRARVSLRVPDGYRRAAALGAAAASLGIGVHSLVDFGLQVTGIAVVFAALVVILVADQRVELDFEGRVRKDKALRP